MKWYFCIAFPVFGLLIAETLSISFADPVPMQGAVIDRHYTAAWTELVIDIAHEPARVETRHHPARYTVIVQFDGGAVETTTSLDVWSKCEKGRLVGVERRQSWSGLLTDYRINP